MRTVCKRCVTAASNLKIPSNVFKHSEKSPYDVDRRSKRRCLELRRTLVTQPLHLIPHEIRSTPRKVDMSFFHNQAWLTFVLAAAVPVAMAQVAPSGHEQAPAVPASGPPSTATASDPASSSLIGFESAFQSYRSYADERMASWSQANDQVGRIGGWRAYAREAQEPAASGTSATTTPTAPAAAPGGGHGAHKQP